MEKYVPLSLKYRPTTFSELIGMGATPTILQKCVYLNRTHPCIILHGKQGTGKTSTARILSKALCCTNTNNGAPCNECKNCKLINKGTYPDVLEIDGGVSSGIDFIRALADNAKYGPSYGKYKIWILDEAQTLSSQAWNSMLKTLEEPSSAIIFILCTTALSKIPMTIRDRAQMYYYPSIPEPLLYIHLVEINKKENLQISEDSLKKITKRADGSVRDALVLIEQVSLLNEQDDTLDIFLGHISIDEVKKFFDYVLNLNVTESFRYIKSLRFPIDIFLDACLDYACKLFINTEDAPLKYDDAWIRVVSTMGEWKTSQSKAMSQELCNEMYTLQLIAIFKEGFKKDTPDKINTAPMHEQVIKLTEYFQGTCLHINDLFYVIDSKKGNKITITDDESKVESGYYLLYPVDTSIVLASNNNPLQLLRTGVLKKKE